MIVYKNSSEQHKHHIFRIEPMMMQLLDESHGFDMNRMTVEGGTKETKGRKS